jgi:hypothetical protein
MHRRKNMIPRRESFTCTKCKAEILAKPGIERNHCSHCLSSLHVDLEIPGDRQSPCRSLMEPMTVSPGKRSGYIIIHRCTVCDKIIPNKSAPDDNVDLLINLINANPAYAP